MPKTHTNGYELCIMVHADKMQTTAHSQPRDCALSTPRLRTLSPATAHSRKREL